MLRAWDSSQHSNLLPYVSHFICHRLWHFWNFKCKFCITIKQVVNNVISLDSIRNAVEWELLFFRMWHSAICSTVPRVPKVRVLVHQKGTIFQKTWLLSDMTVKASDLSCYMTHSVMLHDTFCHATWHILSRYTTHSVMLHDTFCHTTWHILSCYKTHSPYEGECRRI
jgi:hypothetical protein